MSNDIRFALRGLLRSPGFGAVAILALALGIGATTAIFTVVDSVLLRPLPLQDSSRLFRVAAYSRKDPAQLYSLSDPDYLGIRSSTRTFADLAAYFGYGRKNLTGAGEPVPLHIPEVSANFWSVLGVNPMLGRPFLTSEVQAVILSEPLWRRHFHSERSIVGKAITLDGVPYVVVGVMPASFAFPDRDDDAWIPAKLDPSNNHLAMRTVVGRLKAGVSPEQAEAEINAIGARVQAANGSKFGDGGWRVVSLRESIVGKVRPALRILFGAVAVLLLIACVNVANLLLARGAKRGQEMAIRRSLGATRTRLVRQMLAEGMVLAMVGGGAGIVFAVWAVKTLLSLVPQGLIPRFEEIHMDWRVLAFSLGISVLSSLLFGLWPALHLSHKAADSVRATSQSSAVRNILVVSEIALALLLLIGAGLMFRTFLNLRAVNPGFRSGHLLTVTVNLSSAYTKTEQMNRFHEAALENLASLPGVRSAGAVNWLPMAPDLTRGTFSVADRPHSSTNFIVTKPGVSPGYFATMGIRLLEGRDFTKRDSKATPGVAIVGLATARRVWGNEDPIGKRVTLEDDPKPEDWLTVVGVVDDVKQSDLKNPAPPAIYQPLEQVTRTFFLASMSYVVRTTAPTSVVEGLARGRLNQIDPNQPIFRISSMDDLLATSTAEPRFYSRVLASFSLVALLLATFGIYGVVAYAVAQRTREIGIRVALGAQQTNILGSVMGRSAALVLWGLLLGIGGAGAATRVLQSFLFEVTPTDAATFAVVSALLAFVALAASYIPARRATRIDPMVALRYE